MAFIGLTFVVVTIIGLISIIYPLRFLGLKSRKHGAAAAIFGMIVVVLLADRDRSTTSAGISSAPTPPATALVQNPIPAISATPPIGRAVVAQERAAPDRQLRFLKAVLDGRNAYQAAGNDMLKGGTRPQRAKDICAALSNSLTAKDWVGTVSDLSSNTDGKGVLAVEIEKGVVLKTRLIAFGDYERTLIEPGSELFRKASALAKRQRVVFSGTLLRGDVDCVSEASLTLGGSMRQPEFMFKFEDIAPI